MEISVTKGAPGCYVLKLGETELTVSEAELKTLLLRASALLVPGVAAEPNAEALTREFAALLTDADDRRVQKLLLLANHADVLVLLKAAERNRPVIDKIYANMSERSRKIFSEDLAYKYKQGVPAAEEGAAMRRLMGMARRILGEDTPA